MPRSWIFAASSVVALMFVLTAPQTVFAADTTVRLTNGGVVHGELMEAQPNVSVRVRLADGEVREIPWANVAGIEDASPPATAPRAAAASPAPAQPEILALQHERAAIGDGGPAVMMIVGGLAFLIFTPIGLGLFALDAACSSTSSSLSHTCHTQGAAIVFTVLGVGGGVIGLWGFIKLLNNSSRREEIDLRIRELHEGSTLGLDLVPRLGGGELRLSLAL